MEKIFPESNKQVNENDEGIPKQRLLNEISENYITGFATAESNVENMKNPSFEKFYSVTTSSEVTKYTEDQRKKSLVLYALFVEQFKL